ncbi:hypothetical protein K2173_011526 [Erythroxylum novogranatense]|uniref:PORR domain-containing protein n=1 Tax=Erythroxylum novogranatense TaxID=1862640 RepID=A0AAV8TUM0_9ROSI|nr:hypothetical protein K2173_011526 [Erythroxylum novogranatense]
MFLIAVTASGRAYDGHKTLLGLSPPSQQCDSFPILFRNSPLQLPAPQLRRLCCPQTSPGQGLDHAVEREKHLRPVLNIKNLIISDPAKSLPLPIIHNQKQNLEIPTRPIDFIRKYPAIFEEYLPEELIQPHIKLTPQVLDLDAEEKLVYQSENYRQDVADRLLKLLMIARINKVPLKFLDSIKWDLGLHQDFMNSILYDFPDCFRLIGEKNMSKSRNELELELVCWSIESAISVVEQKMKGAGMVNEKGMPISFPMQFSKGFEMDKKLKKCTDESEKWTVGFCMRFLIFVSRMVEKDTLLRMGEALLHYPGIFYLSNKIGTYTVVLKEAYKRGLLINNNPVMNIRNQYLHLMHMVIEDRKVINVPGGSKQQAKQKAAESMEQAEKRMDASRHGYCYDEEDEENKNKKRGYYKVPRSRGRVDRNKSLNGRVTSGRNGGRRSVEELYAKSKDKAPSQSYVSIKSHIGKNIQNSTSERSTFPKSKRKLLK